MNIEYKIKFPEAIVKGLYFALLILIAFFCAVGAQVYLGFPFISREALTFSLLGLPVMGWLGYVTGWEASIKLSKALIQEAEDANREARQA